MTSLSALGLGPRDCKKRQSWARETESPTWKSILYRKTRAILTLSSPEKGALTFV